MRVLVLTKIFPNAAEPLSAPFNRQQIAALGRRCEVEVLAPIPWFPGARLAARWTVAGRLTRVPYREQIDGLPVEHPRTPYLPRFGHVASALLYGAALYPALRRRKPRFDVLLGTWAYPDGVAAVALGAAIGLPTVVKLHGSDMDVLSKRPALRRQLAWALPRAARVVAVSRALGEQAEALGVAPDRIDIVTNGVDGALFHPRDRAASRAELGRAGDARKWILFVGRVEADKGMLELAPAFARLAAANPDAALFVVGDGKARAAAEEVVRPLGDRVVFAGARPFAEIPIWMGACDLLTLPSHHEGTPNVVLEALASGRRVVATQVGGIPDVVHRPELGRLVPVGDAEALAAALGEVLAAPYDAVAVAAIGARGGWDDSAARLFDVLARACGAPLAGADTTNAQAKMPKLAPPRAPATLKSRLKALAARALPRAVLVKHGVVGAPRVALTFDDGPDQMTDAYLDVLDRFGVRATFFVVGRECEKHPEALLRIAARGHEVAGHGFTHTAFTKLTTAALRDELARTTALLPPARTRRPLLRPPYGATSVRSLAVSARAGYTSVLWSRDSDDCRTTVSAQVVARLAPDALTPGEIVLLHEAQDWTLAALPPALEALAAAGWQAVTVGEILEPPRPCR